MAKPDDSFKWPGKKITVDSLSGMRQPTTPEAGERKARTISVVDSTIDRREQPGKADTDSDPTADPKTDEAVDEIMKHDGEAVLQAEDDKAAKAAAAATKPGLWGRVKRGWTIWWASPRKRWSTIGVLVAALIAVFAVPVTRYSTLGLVLTADVTVRAVDSKSGKPVSGAVVQVADQQVETNVNGVAVLRMHPGNRQFSVNKKYYTGVSQQELVTLSAASNSFTATLVATGRQVSVKLVNGITNESVTEAIIASQGSTAKTDGEGEATLVIDSGATTQEATISLDGYNTAKVTITADGDLAKNTFKLTPAGKVYFLSNLSGKIDVVKTNLDGSDRAVVLAGTGSEDRNATTLIASRDWKYLALLARRSGDHASLYLIDTTNGDLLTTIDEGNVEFMLVGWSGSRFIYQVNRLSIKNWQANQFALKSFDPTTGHTLLLDQTQGSGTGDSDYSHQIFGEMYLVGDQVVYVKGWSGYGIGDKQAELDAIGTDGNGHKTIKSFALSASSDTYLNISLNSEQYKPGRIYLLFSDNGNNSFYEYYNGMVTANDDLTLDTFWNVPYVNFLPSPSGSQLFWGDTRDGKITLLTGNTAGESPKQVGTLSEYSPYGWYGDNYLLVSKGGSELYIMPAAGGTPLKVTDYYQSGINYYGYGGQ